jgi:hypothetical protein
VTKNILTIEQMTTTANSTTCLTSTAKPVETKTLASSTVQSMKKPRRKWSGEEDSLERGWNDTDTGTLTQKEINYIRWYHATKNNWHNADTD